jgi:hypothetical protein
LASASNRSSRFNYNAYLHARNAFAGKPQRLRHALADFHMPNAKGLVGAVAYPALAANAKLAEAEYPGWSS